MLSEIPQSRQRSNSAYINAPGSTVIKRLSGSDQCPERYHSEDRGVTWLVSVLREMP